MLLTAINEICLQNQIQNMRLRYFLESSSRGRRVPGSRPDSLKIRRVWGLLHAKSSVVVKRPPVGVAWKFGEGVPAQVSSSSSDRGSKLRGPSQNSPRVASKRDVNIIN
ncbi:hypothetical protein AVEN_190610-1 [Araneus ventricosus]|uniref:Uncharacterized protein n=1 Tax=Araneus ventricosus TaxID=182803 RepID=A0A4Y2CCX0_ARAVE|nr:hypothetical protein AVEN_190610-1 [Araneus ventricosus]